MAKPLRIVLCSVLGVFLAGFVLYETRWKEPAYQGKSLSEWLATFDKEPSDEQIQAIYAVQHMGEKTLPHLFEMLHATNSPVEEKVAEFMNEYTLIKVPPPIPAERLRNRALFALAALRDQQARPIINQLNQAVQQKACHGEDVFLFGFMGTNGLPPLLGALTNPAPDVRRNAANALSFPHQVMEHQTNLAMLRLFAACGFTREEMQISSKAFSAAAVPSLLRCLNDSAPGVKRAALISLAEMGERPTNAIPILMADLGSWEATTRRWSASWLRRFGSAAKEAVPALVQMLDDSDETVRKAAMLALAEIDPETADKHRVNP